MTSLAGSHDLPLQGYCSFLERTPAKYPSSRKFLLGQCFVSTGELSKAFKCFVQASHCLCKEGGQTYCVTYVREAISFTVIVAISAVAMVALCFSLDPSGASSS